MYVHTGYTYRIYVYPILIGIYSSKLRIETYGKCAFFHGNLGFIFLNLRPIVQKISISSSVTTRKSHNVMPKAALRPCGQSFRQFTARCVSHSRKGYATRRNNELITHSLHQTRTSST